MRPRIPQPGLVARLLVLGLAALFSSACGTRDDAAPVIKIGLIAPFEGLGRPLGYALLPEVQDAIGAANSSGALAGYRVSLVALNDDSDGAEARAQARALVRDPDVVAIIGPWSAETVAAVTPVLADGSIAWIGGGPAADSREHASVCPPAEALAESLLRRATEVAAVGGSAVVIVGPENALSSALGAQTATADPDWTPGATAVVLHTGDAEAAAADAARWRAAGWRGALIGGPDLAQPWFGDLAGPSAEGTLAIACAGGEDPGAQPPVGAAQAATAAALRSIATVIHTGERPTRAAVAEALAADPPVAHTEWRRFTGDAWRAEPIAPDR